jgi:hypothetical protein
LEEIMDLVPIIAAAGGGVVGAVVGALVSPLRIGIERLAQSLIDGPPVRAVVYDNPMRIRVGAGAIYMPIGGYFFPSPVHPSPPPDNDDDALTEWARSSGGWDVGWTYLLVTLANVTTSDVVVREPRLVAKRSDAEAGLYLGLPGLGGGEIEPHEIILSLDGEPAEEGMYDVRLPKDGVDQFLISVRAEKGAYEWTLEFPVLSKGKEYTVSVGDPKKPWRTIRDPEDFSIKKYIYSPETWE